MLPRPLASCWRTPSARLKTLRPLPADFALLAPHLHRVSGTGARRTVAQLLPDAVGDLLNDAEPFASRRGEPMDGQREQGVLLSDEALDPG